MSDLRDAAQQALEAWDGGDVKWFANGYQVMDALRAALTEEALQRLSDVHQEMEAALEQPEQGGKTGWPPGLLQDDCRGLSKWLASQPDARRRVREAVAALEQLEPPPEAQSEADLADFIRARGKA